MEDRACSTSHPAAPRSYPSVTEPSTSAATMNTARRVRFHRARAISWLAIGVLVGTAAWLLPQHRTDILLVATTVASFYANFAADWSAAEAADDRPVTKRLDRIEHVVRGGHELDGVVDVSRLPIPRGPAPGAPDGP